MNAANVAYTNADLCYLDIKFQFLLSGPLNKYALSLSQGLLTILVMVFYRENDIEECGLELTFSADFEILGKITQHELKEGGADIAVTNENKEEYIK